MLPLIVNLKNCFMKKLSTLLVLFLAFVVVGGMQGCIKDTFKTTYTYTMFTPVYKTKTEVRQNIKSNTPRTLQYPGKLYMFGSYIFLNELDKGIHVIDNSNPASPVKLAFIDIPGNRDLAVKGNILYADLYTDLVTLDISNPHNVQVAKIIDNVFPHRLYDAHFRADTTKIIVDWIRKDTTVVETGNVGGGWWGGPKTADFVAVRQSVGSGGFSTAASSPVGMGGSMARFAIVNQTLYTVGTYDMRVFNITTPNNPAYVNMKNIGMNIETIFPFKTKLFIGSSNGMYIYDVSTPTNPVQQGTFTHVRSCDPVVADDNHAYVTLRSGTACQGFTNQLEVLNISNITNPQLVKVYPMTNPHGLSKDGNYLFICDGRDGLKVYNASDVNNLQLQKTISGIETYDVIAYNKVALVVAKDGLYQYDYSSISDIRLLSKMNIEKP